MWHLPGLFWFEFHNWTFYQENSDQYQIIRKKVLCVDDYRLKDYPLYFTDSKHVGLGAGVSQDHDALY